MTVIIALLIGIVKGLSEFVPISSSGHISIINNLLGIVSDNNSHNLLFAFLNLGCLVSIIVVYWQDVTNIIFEVRTFFRGENKDSESGVIHYPYFRILLLILVAAVPVFFILPFSKYYNILAGNTIFVGIMLILNGLVLLFMSKMDIGKKTGKNMSFVDSILIGLCQCISFLPGLSRVGIIYSAGIACGLRKSFSLKFSVLLSIPTLLISSIVRFCAAAGEQVLWKNIPSYLIGIAVVILTGIGALYLLKILSTKNKLGRLSYYCCICGAICLILSFIF